MTGTVRKVKNTVGSKFFSLPGFCTSSASVEAESEPHEPPKKMEEMSTGL